MKKNNYDEIKIQSGILFEEIRESVLKNALNNDEKHRNIKKEQHSIFEGNPMVVHLADQDIDVETLEDSTIKDYYKYYYLSMKEHDIIEERMYL